MTLKPYLSNLTDAEWMILKPLLPAQKRIGAPREVKFRELINALLYVADNGIKWRAMPHDFPAWQTVYGYFQRWNHSGVWEQVNHALLSCGWQPHERSNRYVAMIRLMLRKLSAKG